MRVRVCACVRVCVLASSRVREMHPVSDLACVFLQRGCEKEEREEKGQHRWWWSA